MQGFCVFVVVASMVAAPVSLILLLLNKLRKKETKKAKIALLVSVACFAAFTVIGALTAVDACEHEYELAESVAATCETDGFEKYHCDLCDGEKTEKMEKLGHDMVDEHRTEPTTECDGEDVNKCSRCGYEEVEVLEKLEAAEEEDEVDLNVTYDEIYKAYKENELVADDLYQYNRYRITAKINGMTSDGLFNLTGGATLTMEKRVGNTRVFFYAEFEKEQEEALKTIKVGDTITFEGECLSAGTWKDCELMIE